LRSIVTLLFLAVVGCASQEPAPPPKPLTAEIQRDLERYSSFRTGSYETQAQAASRGDSTPVRLRIARIWPERAGEFWFYLEYALVGKEDTPYWQRLVLAREARGAMEEVEYELPGDAKRFIGAWRDGKAPAGVDAARLKELPGCRLRLQTQQVTFFNSGMEGRECRAGPSPMPAGAIRISESFITSSSLRAWDRGVDKDGKVIWGSPVGPLDMVRYSQVPR
jgi:hypothetical protein